MSLAASLSRLLVSAPSKSRFSLARTRTLGKTLGIMSRARSIISKTSTFRLSRFSHQRLKTHFDEWFGCSRHLGVVIHGFR